MTQPRIRLRVDFGEGHRIGPGKVDLLAAIADTGSISAAGRQLGMSYRRAWLLINALNQMFEEPVVTTAAGGAQGGGAALTPLGKGLVDAFRTLEEATFDEAIRVLGPFMARMVPTGPPAR